MIKDKQNQKNTITIGNAEIIGVQQQEWTLEKTWTLCAQFKKHITEETINKQEIIRMMDNSKGIAEDTEGALEYKTNTGPKN